MTFERVKRENHYLNGKHVIRFNFLIFVGCVFVLFNFCLAGAVDAQSPLVTLLANSKADYRFDYLGDRTEVEIALDAPDLDGVELLMYAPGHDEPVGRGARKGEQLLWSGKSNLPGTYHAVVINNTPGPILYNLSIKGESVSGVGQVISDSAAPSAGVSLSNGRRTLEVNLPASSPVASLHLTSPVEPAACTPASQLPPVISTSIKLCANEIYPPLRIVGDNIGLFSDDARTSVVTSAGRQFGVNLEGANNWIDGVTFQASADAADAGAFLCQYDECTFPPNPKTIKPGVEPVPTKINGGLVYGGGILLNGSNNVVHNSTVRGGTIGIATVNGRGNKLIDNQLNDLNGWGNFNIGATSSYFVGNVMNRDNHPCTTPDGFKFEHGCETAGWVCLKCIQNVVARNHCELSGNCFYMSGERGLGSNDNLFVENYCAGATDNCFELTFSSGNTLQSNITTADPKTGAECKYPFWIGGSTVSFKNNTWGCHISAEEALAQALASTTAPTVVLSTGTTALPVGGNQPKPTPTPPPGRRIRIY